MDVRNLQDNIFNLKRLPRNENQSCFIDSFLASIFINPPRFFFDIPCLVNHPNIVDIIKWFYVNHTENNLSSGFRISTTTNVNSRCYTPIFKVLPIKEVDNTSEFTREPIDTACSVVNDMVVAFANFLNTISGLSVTIDSLNYLIKNKVVELPKDILNLTDVGTFKIFKINYTTNNYLYMHVFMRAPNGLYETANSDIEKDRLQKLYDDYIKSLKINPSIHTKYFNNLIMNRNFLINSSAFIVNQARKVKNNKGEDSLIGLHYVCYFKNNNTWYEYNDTNIKLSMISDINNEITNIHKNELFTIETVIEKPKYNDKDPTFINNCIKCIISKDIIDVTSSQSTAASTTDLSSGFSPSSSHKPSSPVSSTPTFSLTTKSVKTLNQLKDEFKNNRDYTTIKKNTDKSKYIYELFGRKTDISTLIYFIINPDHKQIIDLIDYILYNNPDNNKSRFIDYTMYDINTLLDNKKLHTIFYTNNLLNKSYNNPKVYKLYYEYILNNYIPRIKNHYSGKLDKLEYLNLITMLASLTDTEEFEDLTDQYKAYYCLILYLMIYIHI